MSLDYFPELKAYKLFEKNYPLSVTQRAIFERRIRLEKELGPLQFQHASLQEQLDQTEQLIDMYKHSPQLTEYAGHQTQLLSQKQKIQEIYNAKFEMLKALDQQLPECYRSELSKKAIGSKVLPATQNASSTTSAPFPATNTTAPKRFLPQPIPIPARPVDLSKPCRCPLCPRSFLHNGGLRVHIERYHTTNYEQVRAILRDQLSKQTSSIIRKGRRIDLLQIARDCLPTISNAAGANFQVSFLLALLKDMKKIEKPRSDVVHTSPGGLRRSDSCSTASASNASVAQLRSHTQTPESIESDGPTCPVCRAAFAQPLAMLHHMRREHLRVRKRHVTDISCSICELQLSDAEMAAHMALHQVTVAELQPLEATCIYSYNLIAGVEKAASIAALASKRGHDVLYRCALCELVFSSLEEMAAHQNEYKRALETDAAGHDADADADEQQYFCETCSLVLPSVCHAQQHCRIEHPESIE